MNSSKVIVCVLVLLFVGKNLYAQPQCVGFKADFTYQHQSTGSPLVKFSNTSTWTDSNTYYLWNYGDGTQKLIFEETYTYANIGVYTVGLYIYKLMGGDTVCRSKTSKTLFVIGGVEDAEKPTISLYPNPISDLLTIETEYITPLKLTIIDVMGRVVITETFIQQTTIPTTPLAQGIYYVEVKTANGLVYREKIKK